MTGVKQKRSGYHDEHGDCPHDEVADDRGSDVERERGLELSDCQKTGMKDYNTKAAQSS